MPHSSICYFPIFPPSSYGRSEACFPLHAWFSTFWVLTHFDTGVSFAAWVPSRWRHSSYSTDYWFHETHSNVCVCVCVCVWWFRKADLKIWIGTISDSTSPTSSWTNTLTSRSIFPSIHVLPLTLHVHITAWFRPLSECIRKHLYSSGLSCLGVLESTAAVFEQMINVTIHTGFKRVPHFWKKKKWIHLGSNQSSNQEHHWVLRGNGEVMDGRCVPRRERQLSLVKVELRVLCMPMRDLCCHLGFRLGEKKTKTKQNMMTVQLLVWGKRILCSFLPCTLWHILLCLYWRIAFVSQFNDGTSNPQSLVKQWAQKPFGIRYLPLSMHIYAFWAIAVVTLWHRNCLVNMIADNQWWMHSGGFGKKKKNSAVM